jgi:DNA mismatch endonuclease (patch repair protein)
MTRIKSQDTKIEVILRKALWHQGIRYKKNDKSLPGKPDIVISKYKIIIFCDGEFWHGKDWITKKDRIHSNRDYWIPKIERNMERDREIDKQLMFLGWTVLRFWDSEIRKQLDVCVAAVEDTIFQMQLMSYEQKYDNDL